MSVRLDSPAAALEVLADIENDLAGRQNDLECAAEALSSAKREKERTEARYERAYSHLEATAYRAASGTVGDRRRAALLALADDEMLVGLRAEAEAAQDALAVAEGTMDGRRRVVAVLETRASIAQSVLKTMRDGAGERR